TGAVLLVESVEGQYLIRADYFRTGPGPAGQAVAAHQSQNYENLGTGQRQLGERISEVHRWSLPPRFSSMIPGASIPASTASGMCWRVRTRSCRTTTSPATMPKPICEATNHVQSIRWSSSGLMIPRLVYNSPDHMRGAMKPPSRMGRRGNIGSITP